MSDEITLDAAANNTESEKRIGNQTPTASRTREYEQTLGDECIELYNSTGRTAQQWQELLIYLRLRSSLWMKSTLMQS